jgi:hypothetical protein
MMHLMLFGDAPEAARSETVITGIPKSVQMSIQLTGSIELKPRSWRTPIAIRSASDLNPRRKDSLTVLLLAALRQVAIRSDHDVFESFRLLLRDVFRAAQV